MGSVLGGAGDSGSNQSKNTESKVDQTVTENSSQTSSGSQEKNPWGPQGGYLQDLWGQAQGAVGWNNNQPNANQQAGWDAQANFAQNGAQQNYQNMQDQVGFLGNTDQLYAESNPYLQSNIDAATTAIQQNLGQGLNQIDQQSVMAGNLGGSRQGVAQGQAIGDATQQAGDVASQMALDNYYAGMQNINNAAQMQPVLNQMGSYGGQLLTNVGNQQSAVANPWEDLMNYGNILQAGNWGQSTSQNMVTENTGSQHKEGTSSSNTTGSGSASDSPLGMFGNFAGAASNFFGG